MPYRIHPDNRGRISPIHFILVLMLSFIAGTGVFYAGAAQAGQWRVTPIRVNFERGARIGTVNVRNDGDTPMNFQVKAMAWTQDTEGKDRYEETNELIFFPKLLAIPPHEERVIRIGLRGPGGGAKEKTYRLYVEEVSPPRKDPNAGGATVAVNVRFAVPLFVCPTKEELGGQLEKTELDKGTVKAFVRNTGNKHFRVTSLQFKGKNAKGEETFSQSMDGWYVLNGVTRAFSMPVPHDACGKTDLIEVRIS
ncbi:MAG TPA: fimbria/pilus periplasmic chaperone, partial [Geobacteraceae bacterium]|nr:fimbria/pilus periplasmic chaperone [Geobacteraceae bacterium]